MKKGDMAFHKDRGITVVSGFPQRNDSSVVIAAFIDNETDSIETSIFSENDLISLDVDPRLENYRRVITGAGR